VHKRSGTIAAAARVQVHRPRACWYGTLLGLAALIGGPFAWIIVEFVAVMAFVSLVTDLALKTIPIRLNKRRALRVAIAMVTGSAACSIVSFILDFRSGGPVYMRNGFWCALFCGEGVLHYVEHIRRAAVMGASGQHGARR
jgi:hypothetical protein